MKESEIMERLKAYSPEYTDELKFKSKIATYMNKLEELGYVENLTKKDNDENQTETDYIYKINKIIRAIVSPDFLTEFRNKLSERNELINKSLEGESNE